MSRPSPRGATGVQIGEAQARGMILQGGVMVFIAKGARAASVEDILEAARVSRRTFYRLYSSKDDVLLALYRMGTDRLLAECQAAVTKEADPMTLIERFIDAHLRNARDFSRLVFVLGGEAARQESVLHARRVETHELLVAMLVTTLPPADPLLIRGLLLALEGVTRMILEEGDHGRKVEPAAFARVRRVMMRMATAALAGEGPRVAPLPPPP